jgi:hypothetical protein
MQVRMQTFEITEQDRRAIRFTKDGRKTMCTRIEAKEWIDAAVNRALADLRYRWSGPQVPAAVAAGADPEAYAQATNGATAPVSAPVSAPVPAAPAPQPVGANA